VVGVVVVAWALLEQDQVVLVEPVVVVREEQGAAVNQAQPLDQMVLTVLAVEVVAQVVLAHLNLYQTLSGGNGGNWRSHHQNPIYQDRNIYWWRDRNKFNRWRLHNLYCYGNYNH
jgi:hypothetical protein